MDFWEKFGSAIALLTFHDYSDSINGKITQTCCFGGMWNVKCRIFNVFTLYPQINLATPDCIIKTYQE
jgi:hypothetical protein